jgi:hypothetical protein
VGTTIEFFNLSCLLLGKNRTNQNLHLVQVNGIYAGREVLLALARHVEGTLPAAAVVLGTLVRKVLLAAAGTTGKSVDWVDRGTPPNSRNPQLNMPRLGQALTSEATALSRNSVHDADAFCTSAWRAVCLSVRLSSPICPRCTRLEQNGSQREPLGHAAHL